MHEPDQPSPGEMHLTESSEAAAASLPAIESPAPNVPSPSEVPAEPPPVLEPVQLMPALPPLWLPVTILCSILFVLLFAVQFAAVFLTDRDDLLDAPEEYLEHVMGRELDLEEQMDKWSWWERWFAELTGYKPGDALHDAIDAYEELNAKTDWLRTARTLVVLLGEAGRRDEMEKQLEELEYLGSEADFIATVRYAYDGAGAAPPSAHQAVAQVHPAWAQDRLRMRLASREGDREEVNAIREKMARRGRLLYERSVPLTWWLLGTLSLGAIVLLGWLIRGMPSPCVGSGQSPAPWTAGRGGAVMVRAALAGTLIELALTLSSTFETLPLLKGLFSVLRILPLLWLGSRYLLQPTGNTLVSCFGLNVPFRGWMKLLLFTIGLTGIDFLGSAIIMGLSDRLGIESHWSEMAAEEFLWDPSHLVFLNFFDGVVWAPIFEEIGFRGFLYTTLRTRLAVLPAAVLTGVIFGAVHMYSLAGFLAVTWSGLVWSVAYEKSRSLLPGMLSHSLGNVMAFGSMVLIYR